MAELELHHPDPGFEEEALGVFGAVQGLGDLAFQAQEAQEARLIAPFAVEEPGFLEVEEGLAGEAGV